MTIDSGTLIRRDHVQLRVVAAPPAPRRIEIDLLWTTEAVHRVIHLHSLPTMIVVVFVKHEIHRGPTGGKKRVVTLVVRHVHQLVYLPPVVPFKAGVKFWIALHRRILMDHGAIRYAWSTNRSEEHTSELQSRLHLVCRLLLEKKKKKKKIKKNNK